MNKPWGGEGESSQERGTKAEGWSKQNSELSQWRWQINFLFGEQDAGICFTNMFKIVFLYSISGTKNSVSLVAKYQLIAWCNKEPIPTSFCYDDHTSSVNMHVLFIGERALRNTTGALDRNRARIEISSNVSKSNSDQITSPTEGVSELLGLLGNARQIRELIDTRDGITEFNGFTYGEISSIIQDLCCC